MILDSPNIDQLVNQLDKKLPGTEAQNRMSPIENAEKYQELPEDHRVACVLALMHHKNDSTFITFIKRTSIHPEDKHAGQIGFPGGGLEEIDDSLMACAIRETNEEIGIPQEDIRILGALTPLYVFASNYLVHPFLGIIDYPPSYILQESEVAEVIEVPLTHLLDDTYKTNKDLTLAAGFDSNVPGYDIDGHFLWGATAMIASEIEELLGRMDA